jgi:hypothetical protein
MAVEGIGNLVQNFADHLFQQGAATPSVPRIVGSQNLGIGAPPEDTFTPSAQNNLGADAQNTGIFQPGQGALSAATAGILPPQAPPNAGPSASSPANTGAANANSNANGQQGAAADASVGPGATPGQANSGPAASAQVQLEIQKLNASLPALGLTNDEIQEIDRIASLIKNFNPAAYADLVNQFEARSQGATQQTSSGAPQVSSSSAGLASTAGAGANSTDNDFHVQTLLPPQTAQGSAQPGTSNESRNPAATSVVFPAPGLQGLHVEFTSPTGNGSGPPAPES